MKHCPYSLRLWPMRAARPTRILFTWVDPFDERMLCSEETPYDARRSADGFYSRRINRARVYFKAMWSDVLQGRTPRVRVQFIANHLPQ